MIDEKKIIFKGSRDGLHLIINKESNLQDVKEKIQEKMASAQSFFQDITKIKLNRTSFSQQDMQELSTWLKEEFEIEIEDEEEKIQPQVIEALSNFPIEEGMTKFIYTTLRSGQRIQYKGNIVIIGDVNPGAEVVATGNIIVMGALRGIAHAGSDGNEYAFVVAFSLQPTQLRISNIIARSPDQPDFKPTCAEKACINEDTIIILPYYKNI